MSSTTEAAVNGPISVQVFNRAGDSVATISVDPADFGGVINKQLLQDCVLMYRANQRAGTHSTLRRGEVAGSTKKLFRQKGTGNARAGTRRTNKRRGGGTAKGPKPRDYSYRLPKKALRAATRMAILSKFADNEVTVIDDLNFAQPKTKEFTTILKALKLTGLSCLMCTDTEQPTVYKSGRNIRGVGVLPAAQINAYEVLKRKRLLLTRAALEALRKS
ncbi:MAG: 50S ribosomal protein L4 [Gemmataceae bacterium]